MRTTIQTAVAMALVLCGAVTDSAAQGMDLTIFAGRAFPVYEEELRFAPLLPALPRVNVRESNPLIIQTDGGAVFGGALGVEFGLIAIEARIDRTHVGFDINGTRYDLVATAPAIVQTGSVTIGAGRFDADPLNLTSVNLRLRTPGPISLVASGGLTYLPGVTITGTLPITIQADILGSTTTNADLRLEGRPAQSEHRWGLNGGAGIRIGGGRVALLAEARGFYFREFELGFTSPTGPDLLNAVLGGIPPVRFEPVMVNAQVGLVFKF